MKKFISFIAVYNERIIFYPLLKKIPSYNTQCNLNKTDQTLLRFFLTHTAHNFLISSK